MENLDNPINNLWKRKLTFFSFRSTSSMFIALWMAPVLILSIVISGLNSKIVVVEVITIACFIVSAIFFRMKINRIRNNKKRQKYKYPLIAVLFNIHAVVTLATIAMIIFFFGWSITAVGDASFGENIFLRWSAILSVLIFGATLVSGRLFLKNKTQENSRFFDEHAALVIKLVTPLLLVGILILRMGTKEMTSNGMVIISLLGFLMLVAGVAVNCFELYILLTNQWPIVKREGSKFSFAEESELTDI